MKQVNFWLLVVFGLLAVMVIYFSFNPSYQRSIEAKYHYLTADYSQAHTLASEAFDLDRYNRMAATVMTQSKTALKFVDYIDESKKYLTQISKIAEGASISGPDRVKMKMMCEIMMESYVKISPIKRDGRALLLDDDLLDEARQYHQQFVDLYDQITAAL